MPSSTGSGEAAILPRILAIGDIDEDEFAFADAATGDLAAAALDLPPAIAPLERRLMLAQLILDWASQAARRRGRRAADRQYAVGGARRSPTISRA